MELQTGPDDMDVDPNYKVFLDNLREDGGSYIFEIVGDHNISPVRIKYEEQYQSCDVSELTMLSNSGTPEVGKPDHNSKVNHLKRPVNANSTDVSTLEEEDSFEDESYRKFLDHIRIEDGFMVLDCKPGILVKYEMVKVTSDASHGFQTVNALFPDERGLLACKVTPDLPVSPVEEHEGDRRAIASVLPDDTFQYKHNLLKILSKPFDQNEYNELLRQATERKPLTKQKHLRSMSISYATNIPGMSYFDHHPDLARQFEGADCYRGLALLRGFFFWLKNLCHEGSFIPWVSSSAEMMAANGYEMILPLDDSPINEIRDALLENELTEDQRAANLLLESSGK